MKIPKYFSSFNLDLAQKQCLTSNGILIIGQSILDLHNPLCVFSQIFDTQDLANNCSFPSVKSLEYFLIREDDRDQLNIVNDIENLLDFGEK